MQTSDNWFGMKVNGFTRSNGQLPLDCSRCSAYYNHIHALCIEYPNQSLPYLSVYALASDKKGYGNVIVSVTRGLLCEINRSMLYSTCIHTVGSVRIDSLIHLTTLVSF